MTIEYNAVWISDAHLCSRECRLEDLLEFVRRVRCKNIYLVGDFIDLWQFKRRWHWPQEMNNVFRSLLGQTKHDTRIIYIPGNHDEGVLNFAGANFGNIQICKSAVHTAANGKKYLVLHGHEFDAVVKYRKWLAMLGSAAYDYLVTANRIFNAVRRMLGLPYVSFSAKIKRRVKQAMTYIHEFESAAAHEARKQRLDGVICGHIHQPAVKKVDGVLYCNTGDWVESCSAAVEHKDGRIDVISWHEMRARFEDEAERHIEPADLDALFIG